MSDLDLVMQAFNKAKVQGDVANAKRFAQIALDLDKPSAPAPAAFVPDPNASLPNANPRDRGFFREVLDVPTQVAKGAVTGTRFLTDVFGADNPVSRTLSGVEDELDNLLSAQAKRDQQEVARIMQQAEDKGIGDQIKAGLKAMSVAPVDLISNAFGTSAPILIGGLLAPGGAAAVTGRALTAAQKLKLGSNVATGLGVLTGVGITKDAAYDAVLQELVNAGVSEDEAKAAAKEAQAYSGDNLDNIAFGGFLGGVASRFGLESSIFTGSIGRRLAGEVSEEAIEQAAKTGVIREASRAAITEAIPEALQGGQEQFTRNVALQREGFDVPTGRGIATAATLEGAVGAPVGAIAAGGQRISLKGNQEAKIAYINELADNIGSNLDGVTPPPPSAKAEVETVDSSELTQSQLNEALTVANDTEITGLVDDVKDVEEGGLPDGREQIGKYSISSAVAAQFRQNTGKDLTEEVIAARIGQLANARNVLDRAKEQNLEDFEIKELMKRPGAPPAPETGFADIQKTNQETPLSRGFLSRISAMQRNRKNLSGAAGKTVSYFLEEVTNEETGKKQDVTADPTAGLFDLAYDVATDRATTEADIEARRAAQENIPATEEIKEVMGKDKQGKNLKALQPVRTPKQQNRINEAATYFRDIADPETNARFDNLVESIKQRHQDGIIEQARSVRLAGSSTQDVDTEMSPDEREARAKDLEDAAQAQAKSEVTTFKVARIEPEGAPDFRKRAEKTVREELDIKQRPRNKDKRAAYDSKVQAETKRLSDEAQADFESTTSERINQQIEAQGIVAPDIETKYKGKNIDPEVVAIAESGNLRIFTDELLSGLPKELQGIVRFMRRLASATKIQIAPIEGGRPGRYDADTDTITLDPEKGLNTGIFFHELAHAALARRIADPNSEIAKEFFNFYSVIQTQMGDAYVGTDLQEFVAELFEPTPKGDEFRQLLQEIKPPKGKSLWNNILDAILRLFGVKADENTNAYDVSIEFINGILNFEPEVEPPPLAQVFYANASPDVAAKAEINSNPSFSKRKFNQLMDKLNSDSLRVGAMGFLRLDNLMELYGDTLKGIKKIITNVELRQGYQEREIEAANKKFNAMLAVADKFKVQTKAMAKMAVDARLARVDLLDPNFAKNNKLKPDQVAELKRLKAIYNTLPKEVQNVYKVMRNDFDNMYKQYKKEVLDNIADPNLRAELNKKFGEEPPIAGYIPARRYGEFVLNYVNKKTGKWTSTSFESRRLRDEEIKTLGLTPRADIQNVVDEDNSADYADAKEAQTKLQAGEYTVLDSIKKTTNRTLPGQGFVADLMAAIRQDGAQQKLSAKQIQRQVDTVYETYLDLFPESSIAQSFRKAKDIPGMSEDIIRIYGDTMVKWARKMADIKYNGKIQEGFDQVREEGSKVNNDPDTPNKLRIYAAAKSIADRNAHTINPTFGDLAKTSTTGSYVMFMSGNISSGVVNLSSIPLLTFPILSGKFGGPKATVALTKASRVAVIDILKTEGVPGWADKNYEGGRYGPLYKILEAHGQLRHTLAREVLEGARQTSQQYNGLGAKMLNLLSMPIERTERYNRTTTGITAFDLALDSGMSPDAAAEYALRIVKDVNTSGMSSTAPKWMQGDIGRVMWTFKGFIWQSSYVTAKAFVDSIKGAPDRTRREAFRQLLYTMGMSYGVAGAFGMPFFGAISVLVNMINNLIPDDEEPFNLRREMMMVMPESVTKGPLNYYLNLEISNRASVANGILFREDPYEIEKYGYLQSMALQTFGPLGNYVLDAPYKLGLMANGEFERGVEGLLPSWARNGLKTMRFAREGARTIDGRPIDEDISGYNLFMQALGFSPANVSSLYETRALSKQYESQVLKRRSKLLQRRYLGLTTGDSELLSETTRDIYEFMARYPELMSQDTLNRSIKSRTAQEQEYVAGIRFNKSFFSNLTPLFDRLEDVNYYGAL